MKMNRRNFMTSAGLAAGALLIPFTNSKLFAKNFGSSKMKLTYQPYTLNLKHVFTIATNSRSTTAVMLTQIEWEGVIGYGEASMPPYLGESHENSCQLFI